MSTTTANYGLVKPAPSDRISIADITSSFDTIDTNLFNKGFRSKVVVGPGGDYASLGAVFTAYPTGGVDIYINATTLTVPSTINISNCKNVRISGRGPFGSTILTCTTGFIDAVSNSDAWTIENLKISHASGTNTDDCIVVDYPRRWCIQRCYINGFGGASVNILGGLHCEVANNYIIARDSTGTNGVAGIRITKSVAQVVPTTIRTVGNYIGGGVQYGIYADHCSSFVSSGDIAESMACGMRFEVCDGELAVPYTEAISGNHIELVDSTMTCIGRFRAEPTVTWSAMAAADRYITRVSRNWTNPGKAIIFGGTTAGTDATTSPSIRWGTGTPEASQTGVIGSIWMRTDGSTGTTMYVKEAGAGNTGWVAK